MAMALWLFFVYMKKNIYNKKGDGDMLSFRYSVIFVIMVALLTSVTFAGQNANAKVALDLYTVLTVSPSNTGTTSLDGIGADTDIYVKVYLQDVSNIELYRINLLIDPTKLTWVKLLDLTDAAESYPPVTEVNILKKENPLIGTTFSSGSIPGNVEGIYKRIQIASVYTNRKSAISDTIAPDGEGLAGLIQLKTTSSFTTGDKARILVKDVYLYDNSRPVVEEYGLSNYSVAGTINPVATESMNTPVEESVTTNTSTVSTEFADGSKVGITFTSGEGNAGKTVTVTSMGASLSGEFATDTNKTAIEGKTAAFYNIETTIVTDFTAELQFTFTGVGLLAAGASDDPEKLVLAYFREAEDNWMRVPTVIDAVNLTATATVSSFSVWALVDSTDPHVVPVELMSFAARTDAKDGVMLEWATSSETNNYGFYIERSIDNENFNQIGFVRGSGNSSKEISYSYIDADVYEVGTYYYRLRQVDFDGKFEYSGIVSVNIKAPDKYTLLQAYPNPFNPVTNIEFNLKENGYVRLMVYNTLGQVVQTLVDDDLNAGKHKVTFNARNLASGIYIYKLNVNGFTDTKKIVLVK